MQAIDVLKNAKAVIADPQNWCQGHLATDNKGNEVDTTNEKATCFCALGALYKSFDKLGNWNYDALQAMNDVVQMNSDYDTITAFNDETDRKHSDVVRMFNKAIVMLS